MQWLKLRLHDLIGLLFPDLCNACGVELLGTEQTICTKCIYNLPFTDYHLHTENKVAKQFWGRVKLESAMAMLYFRKATRVQNLIHNLKYNGKTDVGSYLGTRLGEQLIEMLKNQEIDFIIPVPLHPRKLKMRGYNQSSFIARGLSSVLGKPMREDVLIRKLSRESQTTKNRYDRYENMQLVFETAPMLQLKDVHILLIDDVITTGATLEACAKVLLENGAAKVSIAAVAFVE